MVAGASEVSQEGDPARTGPPEPSRDPGALLALPGLAVLCWAFAMLCQWVLEPGLLAQGLGESLWLTGWLAFPLVAAALFFRTEGRRLGLVFVAIGLATEAAAALRWTVRILLLVHHATGPGARLGQWLTWLSGLLFAFAFTFAAGKLLLLFPTGRLPSPRWRPIGRVGSVLVGLVVGAEAIRPGAVTDDLPPVNPIGVRALAGPLAVVENAALIALAAVVLAGLTSAVRRWRASTGLARRQLANLALAAVWMLGAAGLMIVFSLSHVHVPTVFGDVIDTSVTAAVPLATAAALRHRLFDAELALRRSATYLGVSCIVVGAYAGIVVGLSSVFEPRSAFGASLVATGLVAVAFGPLKEGVQGGIDRLLYGSRRSPYLALARVGQRLADTSDPEQLLTGVVDSVAQALRLPYVGLVVGDGPDLTAGPVVGSGSPRPAALALPLVFGGRTVGRLLLAARAPGERFGEADLTLLGDLGRQIAGAVHALALTRHLRNSRERLVLAREEERRRLRRDLHDGLGPSLAAVTLQLDALRRELAGAAPASLPEAKSQVQACVGEVRRLVHGLRPPALDELGLVGAVGHAARQLCPPDCAVEVRVDGELPGLPAAVEVAAYRIVTEALTNVSRHARAGSCVVEVACRGDQLVLVVRDDGVGTEVDLRTRGGGVGIASMRERAEELGGGLSVDHPGSGGTVLTAVLPVVGEVARTEVASRLDVAEPSPTPAPRVPAVRS